MRSEAALFVMALLLAPLAVACSEGGTGTGTAPPPSAGCPADPDKVAGQPCGSLNVCAYPTCDEAGVCPTTTKVATCSGAAGATWVITTPTDAGGFTDANLPDNRVDETGTDGSSGDAPLDAPLDATDASDDATDATSSDATDDAPDADAPDAD